MSHGYNDTLTIDRIDTKGDYCPDNCQWLTKSENTAKANREPRHRSIKRGLYYAVSPDGNHYIFDNANAFCREHTELNANCLRGVASGSKHTHHGWTCSIIHLSAESLSTIERMGNAQKQVEYIGGEIPPMEVPSIVSNDEDIVSLRITLIDYCASFTLNRSLISQLLPPASARPERPTETN